MIKQAQEKLPGAKYIAQDQDGQWWAYTERPQLLERIWYTDLGYSQDLTSPDWKLSMTLVPTVHNLKACPFCGAEAATTNVCRDLWQVGCDNDQCVAFITADSGYYPSEFEAIKAWNTRL